MMTIYKYQFKIAEEVIIEMPEKSKILCVQLQSNIPTLWAIVNTESPIKKRTIQVIGTGWPMNESAFFSVYIGTFQSHGFVWHVFEKK